MKESTKHEISIVPDARYETTFVTNTSLFNSSGPISPKPIKESFVTEDKENVMKYNKSKVKNKTKNGFFYPFKKSKVLITSHQVYDYEKLKDISKEKTSYSPRPALSIERKIEQPLGLKVFRNKASPHKTHQTPKSISEFNSGAKVFDNVDYDAGWDFFEDVRSNKDTINSECFAQAPMV